ncbi:5'-methylthioadenosine/S-adenosylhomocysteine nucleosidase [Clostridia bacterium]|nr:5'-methylthioadenosine/S-adenosylhomocysteine nucleosidase [Clostridia bacterium]
MIGIIGALDVEVTGLINEMADVKRETISKIVYTIGKIKNKDCVVAQCGIGKVNAAMCAQTMVLKYNPTAIINSGVAGALAHGLKIGDIVIANEVVQHDVSLIEDSSEPFGIDFPRGTIEFSDEKITHITADPTIAKHLNSACKEILNINSFTGIIATGEQFVASKAARLEIGEYFNALACEMEGGAIGQVCYRNSLPFAILRAISDNIDTNQFMDFLEFKNLAAKNSIAVINRLFDFL